MLDAFFELNTEEPNLNLLYADVPYKYVYNNAQRKWQERVQRADKVVSRIHMHGGLNSELFALRVLLLNVPSPLNFEHIRRVNGHQYETYREAAKALHLITDDQMYYRTFTDLIPLRQSPQLRHLFATLLINYVIDSAADFWLQYKDQMIDDFRRGNPNATDDELYNLALLDLNARFLRVGRTCRDFRLPLPTGIQGQLLPAPVPLHVDPVTQNPIQAPQAPIQIQNIVLNPAQQHGFDRIMGAARRQHNVKCFVVIGPGGSGKTTLYKRIIEACNGDNLKVSVFATTGIAATLMEGGMTVHRGFSLPISMDQTSTSPLQRNHRLQKATILREANVILIDEITMLNCHGLRIIDNVLRSIMLQPQLPFGGKVIVVGGDFRQLLPVVPGASRPEILANCVTASPLWKFFERIILEDNMRAQGDAEFIRWLLQVGTGSLPPVREIHASNMIEIPREMLLQVPQPQRLARGVRPVANPDAMPESLRLMISTVFGNNIANLTTAQLSTSAILAKTIKEVTEVNDFIIAELGGGPITTYLSVDNVVSNDPNDELNYPVEYLNNQQPSGLPPHKLKLRVGVVIMLLRNLSPEDGLSNGTRLKIVSLRPNAIVAEILSECNRGAVVFIPKLELESGRSNLAITMKRLQFPVIPAYAMTINKSQGQTLDKVGIYLNDVVFAHGQLYVALSRCRNKQNIKIFVKDQDTRQGRLLHQVADRERVFTRNVIFREVFVHGELLTHVPHVADEDPLLEAMLLLDFEEYDAAGPNLADIDPELNQLLLMEFEEEAGYGDID